MNATVKLDSKNPVQLVRGYEVIIGFETHAQLATNSKIFSRSSTAFGAEPNTQASAFDMALPGVLPVMNKQVVECAIRFGLAVDAEVAERSEFARKNYFYPDLPKGYQTSQMDLPTVVGGVVTCFVDGEPIEVRLVRAHLEEDAGKSLHEDFVGQSGIDLNRAGTPLLEIVTEPDLRSSAQAVAYAKELHKIVTWIGICDGNMQEGSFRCDANVSVRKPGGALGTRREIKNLNSFRNMQQAIDYEIQWQIDQIKDGYAIEQATVLFDADTGETRAMRSKEDAHDYRYFPCPDLPALYIARSWLGEVQADMPELPAVMAGKYVSDYKLPAYDANLMTQTQGTAAYFEAAVAASNEPKLCSNWVMGEISKRINANEADEELLIENIPVTADKLGEMLKLVAAGTISNNAAKKVFDALWDEPEQTVDAVVEAKGLKQVNDAGALQAWVDKAVADNPQMIEQYRAGKDKALNALVGKVMGMSKGKANPGQVMELLKKSGRILGEKMTTYILTDLTRFSKLEKVCVAVIDPKTGQCFRPMPYLTSERCSQLNIQPGAKIVGNLIPNKDSKAPHIEDSTYQELKFVGVSTAQEFKDVLVRTCSSSVSVGFNVPLEANQKHIPLGTPAQCSILTVRVRPDEIQIHEDSYSSGKIKLSFFDSSGHQFRYLAITDRGFYDFAKQHQHDGELETVQELLQSQEEIFLRIGLSRCYKAPDGREGFWLQVNGIYSFPNYPTEIRQYQK